MHLSTEGLCSTRLRRDIIQMLSNEQVGSVYSRVLVLSAMFCLTGFVAKLGHWSKVFKYLSI
ncbi:hypothetical protein EA848_16730 [Vibrio anguillarum]|nr:hypothetical protein [Vibrio anguillarum]MBF4393797.1 hypothetical protein [Vibrio anguillarum]MBF4431230.1 hypothetical protein [Vibrio anguillarum]